MVHESPRNNSHVNKLYEIKGLGTQAWLKHGQCTKYVQKIAMKEWRCIGRLMAYKTNTS